MAQLRILKLLTAWALLCLLALSLVGCPQAEMQASYVKHGEVRDTLYAVEDRGNGVQVLWMTHSDTDLYCLPKPKDNVGRLIAHSGEVIVTYQVYMRNLDNPGDPDRVCAFTEGGRYTVNVVSSIELVSGR